MATKTVINISPKVFTGLLTGLGIAAAGGVTDAVTPHTFDFLGPWGPAAFAVATILLAQAAAWFKREQQTTEPAAPTETPTVVTAVTPTTVEPLVPQSAEQIITGAPTATASV